MKALKYWNSDKIGAKYLFEINKEENTITLGIESKREFSNIAPAKEYEFFEGLWEYDVVEAFISTGEKSYIEINLSTTGAFWLAEFSDHRERTEKKPKIELKEVKIEKNKVVGKFYYQDIQLKNEYNICAILDNKFLSLNSVELKVDFHLKDLRK